MTLLKDVLRANDDLAAQRNELRGALEEANEIIHAEGYEDPEDKLRSLAVIVGSALDYPPLVRGER